MSRSDNRCFVCSPGNPAGLHLQFKVQDGACRARFRLGPQFDGYRGITHGGIQAAILDDAMANIFCVAGLPAFTIDMHIVYHHPMYSDRPYCVEAEPAEDRGSRIKTAHGRITEASTGAVVTEATATFFIGRGLFKSLRGRCKDEHA